MTGERLELAHVRAVLVPDDAEKPRPFDLEVSSDGGKTWASLPTIESEVTEGCGRVTVPRGSSGAFIDLTALPL